MARSMSIMGLTPEAQEYIQQNALSVPAVICPNCETIITEKPQCRIYHTEDVWYGEGPELHIYKAKDGSEFREVIQDVPWSSGPVVFLCLTTDQVGPYLVEASGIGMWTQAEIDDCI